MQKPILLLFLIFFSTNAYCQQAYPYQDIKLEKPTDYIETELLALSAATFLLSTPFEEVNIERSNALTFLSYWMEGAKRYSFYTQGVVQEINSDNNLLKLYVAAMVKYNIEHKTENTPPLFKEKEICKMVLAYCDNPANKFKLKNKYRKKLENN